MLDRLLENKIKTGRLRVHYADGAVREYGHGEPLAHWRFHGRRAPWRLLLNPAMNLGETYMDGRWSTPGTELAPLLKILMLNFADDRRVAAMLATFGRSLQQLNRVFQARRNAAFHYDLDESLFRGFLDADLHYSCAYFRERALTLEQAQQAKCQHLMRKLAIAPGQRVLDIGCGWGSLAMYLAEHAGCEVTGITLSAEQLKVARERARARRLDDRVRFELKDYREQTGTFDRIVSVGMFEHVGAPNYGTFFRRLKGLLGPKGIAVLHHIGRPGPPGRTNPWIRKYIFPGGYNPSLSEVMAPIEATGLLATDVEVWRLHYAHTLAEWQRRFQAIRPEVVARKGERFARMWEFYLAACEASFATAQLVVFQIQMAHALDAVPLTREYLYAPERATSSVAVVRSSGR